MECSPRMAVDSCTIENEKMSAQSDEPLYSFENSSLRIAPLVGLKKDAWPQSGDAKAGSEHRTAEAVNR